jgi:hypothetical protein
MSKQQATMISIWSWVGMVLTVYGVIITLTGIYYAATELPKTVLGETNPSLWWGAFMLFSGIVFLIIGRKATQRDRQAQQIR